VKVFDADKTRMIGLLYGKKNYDHMLSRFHLIPERYGWTDGRTDRFTISISRVNSRVRRIHMSKPTVQQYQQCCYLANENKTCRSLLLFKNNNVARGSQGFVRKSSRNVALRVEQPSVLNKFFFQNYNILPRSGVRAESLRVRSENTPNFVTFWPTLQFKDDQEKIQVVSSLMTLKVHHV